jgi:hypothetical protein
MRPSLWSKEDTDRLCDLVSQDAPFAEIAKVLPYSQRQCVDRFKTIRRGFGWQAA